MFFYQSIYSLFSLFMDLHCGRCLEKLSTKERIFCASCHKELVKLLYMEKLDRQDVFMLNTWDSFYSMISHYHSKQFYDILSKVKFNFKKYLLSYVLNLIKDQLVILKTQRITHITYIPLSVRKMLIRGFNPAYEIANFIAKEIKVPCIRTLKKIESISQGKKNRPQRINTFLTPPFKTILKRHLNEKSRVLIVDDIITTGSTISIAGLLLKKKYDCTVLGFALFNSDPRNYYKDLLEKAAIARDLSE